MTFIDQSNQHSKMSAVPLPTHVVAPLPDTLSMRQWVAAFARLFKLRIVTLLLFSAFGGAALGIVAGGQWSFGRLLLLAICGSLSAAGASAINQYLEIDRDRQMARTAQRPLVIGVIRRPILLFVIALSMVIASLVLALLAGNRPLAFWLMAGAVIYVAVYTIWLKPRSVMNIVIGGAAGSCAVIAGGAAVDTPWAPAVWILAGIVFAWTPVHFWALALAYRDDYRRAAYPMLPAIVSPSVTVAWIAVHTALTVLLTVALAFWPSQDKTMLSLMILLVLPLIWKSVSLWRTPERAEALALFHMSNLFLAAVLTAVIVSAVWRI